MVLRGKPAAVRPVVPAGMLTEALPSKDCKVADAANIPVVPTMLPTETEPTPVTAAGVVVVVGGT
jgi:hypothetical protein